MRRLIAILGLLFVIFSMAGIVYLFDNGGLGMLFNFIGGLIGILFDGV